MSRRTYALISALIVVLLLVFLYAPVVPAERKLNLARDITLTVRDYGSMSYSLFGFGPMPFSGVHTFRATVNGTEVEVVMEGSGYNASIGALPLSKAPLADVRLQLLLNTTQFSGSTLLLTLRNTGDSNLTLLSVMTSFGGLLGQKVEIAPNQTRTISFVIYASPLPVVGETYPVSIYGNILNGSSFRYYTSVEASNS